MARERRQREGGRGRVARLFQKRYGPVMRRRPRRFRTFSGQNLPEIAYVARFLSAQLPQGGYRTPQRRRSEGVKMRPRKIVRPKTVQHALKLAKSDAEMYETLAEP